MRSTTTTILLVLALAVPAAAEWTVTCPAPDDITRHPLPQSDAFVYTAESDGVGFSGTSPVSFDDPDFISGLLASAPGYHAFICS